MPGYQVALSRELQLRWQRGLLLEIAPRLRITSQPVINNDQIISPGSDLKGCVSPRERRLRGLCSPSPCICPAGDSGRNGWARRHVATRSGRSECGSPGSTQIAKGLTCNLWGTLHTGYKVRRHVTLASSIGSSRLGHFWFAHRIILVRNLVMPTIARRHCYQTTSCRRSKSPVANPRCLFVSN